MVALKTPRAPRPSCDRYGHPVCTDPGMGRCEHLRNYVESHEAEIAGKWQTLYRQLHHDGDQHVTDGQLIEAVSVALRELERSGPRERFAYGADDGSLQLMKQVCLTGFECHGSLVPDSDWADQRIRQEIREQLRRRLFSLVKELVN